MSETSDDWFEKETMQYCIGRLKIALGQASEMLPGQRNDVLKELRVNLRRLHPLRECLAPEQLATVERASTFVRHLAGLNDPRSSFKAAAFVRPVSPGRSIVRHPQVGSPHVS
jgi:hypothetical protein